MSIITILKTNSRVVFDSDLFFVFYVNDEKSVIAVDIAQLRIIVNVSGGFIQWLITISNFCGICHEKNTDIPKHIHPKQKRELYHICKRNLNSISLVEILNFSGIIIYKIT